MTIEEQFLNQRIEVISDYPNSTLKIGQILHQWKDCNGNFYGNDKSGSFLKLSDVENSPIIFKKLKWYEKMGDNTPKYVLYKFMSEKPKYLKVDEWKITGEIVFAVSEKQSYFAQHLTPASELEYNYQKK